jgi:protein-L-isoaspartate(D-aspartate) O-methyltransferase
MNYNYQKARNLMVENQLRPNKIKDPLILNLFKEIPKEKFLPPDIHAFSYSDSDITLSPKRGYLKNLHIAQIIKHSDIEQGQKILHLGALTGYVTIMIAKLCSKVFAIETINEHRVLLKKNIIEFDIKNIEIVNSTFTEGCVKEAPFDRIIIDSPIKKLEEEILLGQLSNNLGKIIMIARVDENLSQAVKITKNNNNLSREYLFDVFSDYALYEEEKRFVF